MIFPLFANENIVHNALYIGGATCAIVCAILFPLAVWSWFAGMFGVQEQVLVLHSKADAWSVIYTAAFGRIGYKVWYSLGGRISGTLEELRQYFFCREKVSQIFTSF